MTMNTYSLTSNTVDTLSLDSSITPITYATTTTAAISPVEKPPEPMFLSLESIKGIPRKTSIKEYEIKLDKNVGFYIDITSTTIVLIDNLINIWRDRLDKLETSADKDIMIHSLNIMKDITYRLKTGKLELVEKPDQ